MERQKLRDKYKIAKPVNEDEESEDEDDGFGPAKKKDDGEEDPVARKWRQGEGGRRWNSSRGDFVR